MSFSFTFDLEDHRPNPMHEKRYHEMTRLVLGILDDYKIKGSFFIVGEVAEQEPELIREIESLGHEIGFHSYRHRALTKEDPNVFRSETDYGKKYLEDLAGCHVRGFRAPILSLTRESVWTVDVLQDLGFTYSSSILPASNPLYGFKGLPEEPFFWPNGLLEIPVPVASVAGYNIPFLGGFYFRYLPLFLIKSKLSKLTDRGHSWTYLHPYDFDCEEKFFKIKGASLPVSLLLWFNRRNTETKIRLLLDFILTDSTIMSFRENIDNGHFKRAIHLNEDFLENLPERA